MELPDALYWEATYAIVLSLIETHPNIDLDEIGTEQLFRWITELPNFVDDPALANEGILNEILRVWYEEVNTI